MRERDLVADQPKIRLIYGKFSAIRERNLNLHTAELRAQAAEEAQQAAEEAQRVAEEASGKRKNWPPARQKADSSRRNSDGLRKNDVVQPKKTWFVTGHPFQIDIPLPGPVSPGWMFPSPRIALHDRIIYL
ncbi:hypothetical protein BS47DRAFT_1490101 [Hydnum rufescens UP504]|uniref:Uncharacterized protein n=1 Tax=Hydnum rufescens UP504 TaxID=1448309 RepID=A0A9P6DJN2_9AGAM|nr:hypothetical protein BS47DRAFT_1490101 [Hydnum rufescens UP504]